MKDLETRYLERLSDLYPTIAAASTEIINLQAILNLPKGTELVEESFMMCWKVTYCHHRNYCNLQRIGRRKYMSYFSK